MAVEEKFPTGKSLTNWSTRSWIALLLYMQMNAVLFGTLLVVALLTPVLNDHLMWSILMAVILSLLIPLPLSRWLAPRMRNRYWQRKGEAPKPVLA